MAATGKKIEVMFEKVVENYEHQSQLLNLVDFEPMPGADAQNTSGGSDGANFPHDYGQGVVWKPVQQHSPTQEGYDLTGLDTDIVEETVPCLLGTPVNDFFTQRADQMRDIRFWERRGEQAGKKLATTLNQSIAQAISTQGSLYYETTAANGFDAIGVAQAMMNEREKMKGEDRFMILSDRANLRYAGDLAARGTLTNRPEDAYANGLVGKNVAGFDVYTGSFTQTQALSIGSEAIASLIGTTTSTGDSFIPEGGSVDSVTGIVTNVDYRIGVLGVADTAGFAVGDKVTLSGVNSVALADKSDTGELMTFTVVAVNAGTSVSVYPKPILTNLSDATATNQTLWQAYGNCTGTLVGASMIAINAVGGRSNIFAGKSAVQVNGGTLPANLLNEYDGMKVIYETMPNGQELYLAYSGNINDLSFKCRIFFLAGITVLDPANCGSFVAS